MAGGLIAGDSTDTVEGMRRFDAVVTNYLVVVGRGVQSMQVLAGMEGMKVLFLLCPDGSKYEVIRRQYGG